MSQSSQLQQELPQASFSIPALKRIPYTGAGKPSIVKFCIFVLLSMALLNLSSFVIDELFISQAPNDQQHTTVRATIRFLQGKQLYDSLGPMIPAIHLLEHDRHAPVYQSIFFEKHTKFQYPLTSLIPYYLWQEAGVYDGTLAFVSKVCICVSAWLTVLLTVLMSLQFMPKAKFSTRERTMAAVTVAIGGLLFYPLITGAIFGQIQTILSLGFTVAFCCWLAGYEVPAGLVLGMMVCVKPQYALFFIWALLRKKFKVAAAGLGFALTGFLVSCWFFGLHNNLDYLRVLRFVSAGESYYPNQSMNGLLNRLLFNGNNLVWEPAKFAPYNSVVYYGTVLTSLALLGLALFFPWGKERRGKAADFVCIILVSTMASPIAWQHHYGFMLPVLVWLWFTDYAWRTSRRDKWMFAIAYLLISNWLPPLAAVASIPVLNILQSYLYLGAVLMLILLLKSSAGTSRPGFGETVSAR